MDLIEEKAKELSNAIKESEVYQNYLQVKEQVEKDEGMCRRLNEYRARNFELHASLEGEELYNAMENFERENVAFCKEPLVNRFLSAELDVVRMIQRVEREIVDVIDLDLEYQLSENDEE